MLKLLTDKRAKLEMDIRALLNRAETEKRELNAEESGQLEKMSTDSDALRSQMDSIISLMATMDSMDQGLRDLGHKGGDQEKADLATQFRQLANGDIRSISMKGTPEELRALSKGSATAGGNTVKTTFIGRLYEHLVESASLLRMGATIWNTDTGETIDVPITTAHGTAALVAEAGTIPQGDPAFGKRQLGAYKYGDLILVPNELLTDTSVNLEDYLARQAGRAVGNAFGAHLITGTGSGQPAGIVTLATLGVTGGTGVVGAPTFDNLIDLYYSVIPPYRNSPDAAWLIKDATAAGLRKLKDTSGRYLWEPSVLPGTPDTILGRPVATDPNIAATGLNAKSVIFGDLSAYVVRMVNNIRYERSDEFKFDTDVVAFRCLVRGDGLLIDQTGAVKYFAGGAS
jgi:HK97 family phage major capsid protein